MTTGHYIGTVRETVMAAALECGDLDAAKFVAIEAIKGLDPDWLESQRPRLEAKARIGRALDAGWTDIHGGPPEGAFCRGRNPETGKVERLPE